MQAFAPLHDTANTTSRHYFHRPSNEWQKEHEQSAGRPQRPFSRRSTASQRQPYYTVQSPDWIVRVRTTLYSTYARVRSEGGRTSQIRTKGSQSKSRGETVLRSASSSCPHPSLPSPVHARCSVIVVPLVPLSHCPRLPRFPRLAVRRT